MPPKPTHLPPRYDRVDALRGLAMVWITVFHFCFDFNHFRFITQNFYSARYGLHQNLNLS